MFDNFSAGSLEALGATEAFRDARLVEAGEALWTGARTGGAPRILRGDVRQAAAVEAAFVGADVVVHLAANTGVGPSVADPRFDCETNVIGTLNCLEAARKAGVGRFVFASSGAPAGACEPPITETIAPRPASPYGASKLAGEAYCCAYANAFGLPTVALRFSNVYGPLSGRKGSVVANFIRRGLSGKPIVINGDGRQTRDFIYVDDLVRAILCAAAHEGGGNELFQIATGKETSVIEVLTLLRVKLARMGLGELEVTYGDRAAADVLRNYADIAKARRVLGWEPRVGLEDGLDRTLAWFADARRAAPRSAVSQAIQQ